MPAKKGESRIVRVSTEVHKYVTRKRKKKESTDATLRRLFGLPDRKGTAQPLEEYFVVKNEGQLVVETDEARAHGLAIQFSAREKLRRGKVGFGRPATIVRVRELP